MQSKEDHTRANKVRKIVEECIKLVTRSVHEHIVILNATVLARLNYTSIDDEFYNKRENMENFFNTFGMRVHEIILEVRNDFEKTPDEEILGASREALHSLKTSLDALLTEISEEVTKILLKIMKEVDVDKLICVINNSLEEMKAAYRQICSVASSKVNGNYKKYETSPHDSLKKKVADYLLRLEAAFKEHLEAIMSMILSVAAIEYKSKIDINRFRRDLEVVVATGKEDCSENHKMILKNLNKKAGDEVRYMAVASFDTVMELMRALLSKLEDQMKEVFLNHVSTEMYLRIEKRLHRSFYDCKQELFRFAQTAKLSLQEKTGK